MVMMLLTQIEKDDKLYGKNKMQLDIGSIKED